MPASDVPAPEIADPAESIWSVLGSTRRLSGYHWRVLCQRVLVCASLLLFIVSLRSPAVLVDMGDWNTSNGRPLVGWECLVLFPPLYPSNALLVFSPLWLAICRRATGRAPQLLLATLSVVSTVLVCLAGAEMRERFVGYYLWAAAHVLSTMALLLPVWRLAPRAVKPAAAGAT